MSLMNKKSTEFFLKGFESAFDLYPQIDLPQRFESNSLENGFSIDFKALTNDWKTIEHVIENSIGENDNDPKKTDQ